MTVAGEIVDYFWKEHGLELLDSATAEQEVADIIAEMLSDGTEVLALPEFVTYKHRDWYYALGGYDYAPDTGDNKVGPFASRKEAWRAAILGEEE